MRRLAKGVASMFSDGIEEKARQIEEYARGLATGGTLFEEMGFYYVALSTGKSRPSYAGPAKRPQNQRRPDTHSCGDQKGARLRTR